MGCRLLEENIQCIGDAKKIIWPDGISCDALVDLIAEELSE
jgi:hypothetical protein